MPKCILCCDGNDLPDGEYCRGCTLRRTAPEVQRYTEPKPPPKGTLARAVWDARGGPPPVPFKSYA